MHHFIKKLACSALLGLMVLGVLFIHSARYATESGAGVPWFKQLHFRQIIFYSLGLGALAAMCVIPYQTLARWSYVAYWGSVLLLVLVLIPHIGALRFGARRWIDLGVFQLQPSEIAKIAFILALGNFLARPLDELKLTGNFWKALAHDPTTLRRTWETAKDLMSHGPLDALTSELVYLAVSITNGCGYCIASHTASARAKGMTDEQFEELQAIIAFANANNRLAAGYQVEIDERFR